MGTRRRRIKILSLTAGLSLAAYTGAWAAMVWRVEQ
jgi:hypothetical protein